MRGADHAAVLPIFNTPTSGRRWAGWIIASVIVLGMGESKLIGLVTFDGINAGMQAVFQSKRAEQKAPRDLNNSGQSATVREVVLAGARTANAVRPDYVTALVPQKRPSDVCPLVQSDESPRAPPCGGLLLFC